MTDTWSKIVEWHLVLPPSRPSAYHLAFFAKHLGGMDKHRPVAVLGSTPEFRDLLAKLHFSQIYVFDKSRTVYDRMNELKVFADRELFVEGHWLDTLPTFKNQFAAVLSDLTSGNIPYDQREEFYASISNTLAPDGMFVDKLLIHGDAKPTVKR